MAAKKKSKGGIDTVMRELGSAHWAISQRAFNSLIDAISGSEATDRDIVNDQNSLMSISSPHEIDGTWYAKKQGRIGTLDISGPIIPYRTWYEGFLGFVSIESLTADLEVLQNDPSVDQIIMMFDSPGGVVDGVSEFASKIASSQKPISSHILGDAASAAYWLASQGNRITSVDTGRAGSIGVVTTIVDAKEAYDKKGVRVFDVVSSQSPRKRTDLNTEDGRRELQAVLDGIADVFLSNVASGRGVDVEKVLSDFGQGGEFVASDALARGLIDGITNTDSLISGLSSDRFFMDLKQGDLESLEHDTEDLEMAEKKKAEDKEIEIDLDSVKADAIAAERDRIKSIEAVKGLYADSHPDVRKSVSEAVDKAKFNSDASVESIRLLAAEVAVKSQNSVIASMAAAKEPLKIALESVPTVEDSKAVEAEDQIDMNKVKEMSAGFESVK